MPSHVHLGEPSQEPHHEQRAVTRVCIGSASVRGLLGSNLQSDPQNVPSGSCGRRSVLQRPLTEELLSGLALVVFTETSQSELLRREGSCGFGLRMLGLLEFLEQHPLLLSEMFSCQGPRGSMLGLVNFLHLQPGVPAMVRAKLVAAASNWACA